MDVAPLSRSVRRACGVLRDRRRAASPERRRRRPFGSCRAAWLALTLLGLGVVASVASLPAAGAGTVDINRASATELAAGLPGIGPVKAAAIVAWRRANGPFTDVEQLLEVTGIGPRTLERLRPLVTLGDFEPLAGRVDGAPVEPPTAPGDVASENGSNTVRTVRLLVEAARRRAEMLPPEP